MGRLMQNIALGKGNLEMYLHTRRMPLVVGDNGYRWYVVTSGGLTLVSDVDKDSRLAGSGDIEYNGRDWLRGATPIARTRLPLLTTTTPSQSSQ